MTQNSDMVRGAGPGIALPPPVLLLIVAIPVGLQALVGGRLFAEGWPRIGLGIPLLVVGAVFFVWAGRTMQAAGTSPHPGQDDTTIVTGGPFRFSRNPMTVGMFLGLLGIAFVFDGAWLVLLPLAYGAFGLLQVRREERHLERQFGQAYREYRRRVRRWI